jgi:spermidine synthase
MLVPFVLGACAIATAFTACRLIAPFYGFGPLLISTTLAVSFLGLGVGFLLASMLGGVRSDGAPRTGSTATILAAAWTILLPWTMNPILGVLERIGLRAATIIAVKLAIGVPMIGLGFAIGRCFLSRSEGRPGARIDTLPLASAMFGAALAAPIVVWMLVPLVGLARTLLAVGMVEAIVAWIARRGARRGALAGAGSVLLLAAIASATRFPAIVRDPAHGVVEAREGPAMQYRVLDREDGRFLIADGGIQTLVSAETRDGLLRPSAAFQIIDFFFATPESALVLGLRGGAVAKRLARAGWRVRVVEPDPLAVQEASTHLSFHPDESPVVVADVRVFCRTTSRRYPVVVMDAFDTSVVPFHLITREALETIADRVAENGIMALAIATRGWEDPLIGSIAAMLRGRFRTVIALPTSEPPTALGSIVLLASNRALELPDERLPQPTEYLMNPEEHWGVVQMNHAWFNRFTPRTRGAVVLTDDRNPIDLWSDPVEHASRIELHESFARAPRSW